jgi:Rad3-related DNA helicase
VDVFQAVIPEAERTLMLVPSEAARKRVAEHLPEGFTVLGPQQVEKDMTAFTKAQKAILLLANRYDGIDLPGTDCRMLVVSGRPSGATLLERYFMERLGATSVLRDRIRTRVTQAVGRCTRDEGDFAVVILMGEDLVDWCSTTANVAGLHPELQAEISFGLANSDNRPKSVFVELAAALLNHTQDWPEAE